MEPFDHRVESRIASRAASRPDSGIDSRRAGAPGEARLDAGIAQSLGRDRELKWIYDLYCIGQSVARLSPERVQQQVLEHIIRGFGASSGCLATTNPDGHTLTITAAVHMPTSAMGASIRFGERIMGRVAQEAHPLVLNGDLSADPRLKNGERFDNRPASALCWPLVSDDRVIGVVSINRKAAETPFDDADLTDGQTMVNMMTMAVENALLHAEQRRRIGELARLNAELRDSQARLKEVHAQLAQSEKMASIGQLAAGVAHEINNPVGYVNSNVTSLQSYLDGLFRLIDAYEAAEGGLTGDLLALADIRSLKQELDLGFLRQDVRSLMDECREGLSRVKEIVLDLKDFAHSGNSDFEAADLHKGLDSTLNIVHNELKYKADVVKEYGVLPAVECVPGQLNQVFMNLLVNAAHAIKERGTITVRTGTEGGDAWVEVSDTGAGIPPENRARLFDPFFTTKPVGQGTGLGLSLAYGIVSRHGGRIDVDSEVGKGSTFRVTVPVRHAANKPTGSPAEPTPPDLPAPRGGA
jgi:two-component system, NtrC family, sensor kinase